MKILKLDGSIIINNILFNPKTALNYVFDFVIFTENLNLIKEFPHSKIFILNKTVDENSEMIFLHSTLHLNNLNIFIEEDDIIINNRVSLKKIDEYMGSRNILEIQNKKFFINLNEKYEFFKIKKQREKNNIIYLNVEKPDIYTCIDNNYILNLNGKLYCIKHKKYINA